MDLSSTDTSEATGAATVTIPANQASATFTVTAVDDTLLDGTQTVFVLAAAAGYAGGFGRSHRDGLRDAERDRHPRLDVRERRHGDATVTRGNTDISAALTVTLSSSDTTEATVPATVTIPANQASATFTVTGVNDTLLDGTQTATITATAAGYVSGSAQST